MSSSPLPISPLPCWSCGKASESAKWITDRLSARCTDPKCYASHHWVPLETWNRRPSEPVQQEAVPYQQLRDWAIELDSIATGNMVKNNRESRLARYEDFLRKLAPPLPSDKLRGLVAEWRDQAARKLHKLKKMRRSMERGDIPQGGGHPNYEILQESYRADKEHADELEALLSQEPSSGEAQKPVAWLNTKGDARQVVIAERMSPELSRELSEAEWTSVPLFASPVTDGGGEKK